MSSMRPAALVIACGALAREIAALRRLNDWPHVDIQCLPPELHNHPERIPAAVGTAIRAARSRYAQIFVAYADCGTGGRLDALLQSENVERLPGAHCYEFFATADTFGELCEQEPGTFYLTDFLVRHFDRLVVRTLGIDVHPELTAEYFRNYRRLIYLVQEYRQEAVDEAARIAARLGLQFEHRLTGYGDLETGLVRAMAAPREQPIRWTAWPR